MSKGRYTFLPLTDNSASFDASFELYYLGSLLCTFSRKTLRDDLRKLGNGENWIGSILRLLDKKYPVDWSYYPVKPSVLQVASLESLADYLRSKGMRVVKPLAVSDMEIIKHLESQGYEVEGLVNDSYYSTKQAVSHES